MTFSWRANWKKIAKLYREDANTTRAVLRAARIELEDVGFRGAGPDVKGHFGFEFSTRMAAVMAASFEELLAENPMAENYLELTFDSHTGRQLCVLILNPDGERPHDLVKTLKDECAALKVEVTKLRAKAVARAGKGKK